MEYICCSGLFIMLVIGFLGGFMPAHKRVPVSLYDFDIEDEEG